MKKILIVLAILLISATSAISEEYNTDAMLQYNQGIDFYKVGQYDKAMVSFRRAINLDPDYIDAYYNLGAILEYLQQYDAALTVFKQIIVRRPQDYESVYKAAYISAKLGELEKARTYLTIIPVDSPKAKDAQELAAQINAVIGQPQQKLSEPPSKISQTSGIYENISGPTGITSDKNGNLYVAGFSDNSILKITPDGKRIIFVKDARLNGPIGLATDKSDNIYVANYNSNNVVKVSNTGAISILIANVAKPYCVYVNGNLLFVSCQGSNSVLRYKLSN